MNHDAFRLTDERFARIEPHLPGDAGGRLRVDDRRVILGSVRGLKSGGRWVDAPGCPWFAREPLQSLCAVGAKAIWIDLFDALARAGGPPGC